MVMSLCRTNCLVVLLTVASSLEAHGEWLPLDVAVRASREHCLPLAIVFERAACPYTPGALAAHEERAAEPHFGGHVLRSRVDIGTSEGKAVASAWCAGFSTPHLVLVDCGDEAWRLTSPQSAEELAAVERDVFLEGNDWHARLASMHAGSASTSEVLALADAYAERGELDEALAVLRAARVRGKDLPRADQLKLSRQVVDLVKGDQANAEAGRAHLKEFPEDEFTHVNTAGALYRLGRYRESRDQVRALLDLQKSGTVLQPRVHAAVARSAFGVATTRELWPEEVSWASQVMTDYLVLNPKDMNTYSLLAMLALAADRPEILAATEEKLLASAGSDAQRRAEFAAELAAVRTSAREDAARIAEMVATPVE